MWRKVALNSSDIILQNGLFHVDFRRLLGHEVGYNVLESLVGQWWCLLKLEAGMSCYILGHWNSLTEVCV